MGYKSTYTENYFKGKNSFFYSLGYGKLSKLYFRNLFKPIEGYIKRIDEGKILDVGCAYGFMLKKIPRSFQRFGIDISGYAIKEARKRVPDARFIVSDIEQSSPLKKKYFDVILMNDVLEHLENPEAALRNVKRLLKGGGYLYITTPNLNKFRRKLFRYADKKEHHISMFSHPGLSCLLSSIGFEIIEHWTYPNCMLYMRFNSNFGVESAFICKK